MASFAAVTGLVSQWKSETACLRSDVLSSIRKQKSLLHRALDTAQDQLRTVARHLLLEHARTVQQTTLTAAAEMQTSAQAWLQQVFSDVS